VENKKSMEHAYGGSPELVRRVANWENCSIPFSKEFGWERWSLLLLGDCVLNYIQGDIVEIGVCESSIFFTKMARKYGRKVYHCDFQQSVVADCLAVDGYFDEEKNSIYVGTSDDFFKETKFTPIALGFIDGGHLYDQVKKDFESLFELIVSNGFIFIHDLLPPSEEYLVETRCGDGYLLRKELEKRGDIDILTFPFTAWNAGFTVIRKLPKNQPYYLESGRKE